MGTWFLFTLILTLIVFLVAAPLMLGLIGQTHK